MRQDQFWEYAYHDAAGCWEWCGALAENGYGKARFERKMRYAHRIAAFLSGKLLVLDSTLVVMHKCNNRKCINPGHLDVGTQSDNMRHAISTGRLKPKPPTYSGKVSERDKQQIRDEFQNKTPVSKLCAIFGLSRATIYRIVSKQDPAARRSTVSERD